MHRPVAVATFIVCLATPLFTAAYAQSCPPPTPPPITLQNAEICLGAFNSASTTSGYASYSWSATHGSIVSSDAAGNVTFSADGSGDVTLSVTVTDASGCPSSGSTTVSLRTIPPPALHAYPDAVCPGGFASAYIDPPDPNNPSMSWANVHWTVTNGTITNDRGTAVDLTTDPGGAPATVTVTVTDTQGCSSTASNSYLVRSIPPPTLHAYPDAICPGGFGSAYIDPPDPNNPYMGWSNVHWTITNGTITNDRGTAIDFTSNPAGGQVTITVTATDNQGCSNSASSTYLVRSIPPPTLHAYPDAICPGGFGSAYVDPPDPNNPYMGWSNVHWTITNGTIGNDRGTGVDFTSDPGGAAVTLTVTATDNQGCSNSASTTYAVHTITPPTIHTYPDSLCPGGQGSAYIDPPDPNNYWITWSSVHWSIANGTITNDYGTSVMYTPNPGADHVSLTVTVTDSSSCSSTTSVAIPVNSATTIPVHTTSSAICGTGTAYIDDAPTGSYWTSVRWTVENGSIGFQGSGGYLSFSADGSGRPVVVHVSASNDQICATGSVTVPTYALAAPVIALGSGSCPNSATVTNASTYTSIGWSSGDVIFTSSPYGAAVTFVPVHNGHITISVSAYDENGCNAVGSASYDVSGLADPTISFSYPRLCAYSPITASVPDAGPGVTYQWSSTSYGINFVGSTTDRTATFYSFGGYSASDISIIETNAAGCVVAGQMGIFVPPQPNNDFSSVPASICGTSTTTISTYGPGDLYDWVVTDGDIVSGQGTSSLTFSPHAGVSSVTVKVTITYGGCPKTIERVIPVFNTPTITTDLPTTICSDQIVTLTSSPGATYRWSNGQTTQSIRVANFSGDYSVTVTDTHGCSLTSATTHITVNPIPSPTINNLPAEACSGASYHASIVETFASYAWSGTGVTISGPTNGPSLDFVIGAGPSAAITLTLTGSNGCSKTYNYNITVEAAPNPQLVTDANACVNYSYYASVSQPGAGSKFYWSQITNGRIVSVMDPDGTPDQYGSMILYTTSAPGPLTITVMEVNPANCGTTVSRTVNVTQRTAVTASGPTTFCAGGSVTLTASPSSSYLWSNGATTQSITVTVAGNYSVTESDNACSPTSDPITVTVNPLPQPVINASGPTTFCAGGSVTLTAPSGPLYHWSNGATTQSIVVTASGNYSVTFTDWNGCSATSAATTVTVNAPPTPSISASGPTTICAGGSVTLTASSASSYLWSNGATTQAITVSGAGSYSVTVTGANGCTATSAPAVVTVNALPTATITAGGPTTFCDGASVTLTATAASSYLWSNGATTRAITASTAGSYSVTVTDANGCSATSAGTTVTVTPASTPSITANGPTTFCPGGSVTLTSTPGTSYQWSNGAMTQSITVSSSGNYKVYVTGANGCGAFSNIIPVTVNAAPAQPTISMSAPNAWCDGGAPIVLTSSPAVSYLWSTGQTTQSVSFNTAGSYHVSVTTTDANGCRATSYAENFGINTPPPTTITAYGPTTFCAPGSVTLNAPSSYGMPDTPYTYLWSNGATTPAITVSQSGSYSVTVTNYYGCSATSAPTVVTANDPPKPTITADGPTRLCTTSGQTVTLRASDGASSYVWYNGEHTQSITVARGGTYYVTATYPDGCQRTSDGFTVTEDQVLIQPSGPTNFCNGSVTLTALNNGATSFQWSTGATTQSITVSNSGTYTVTVTFPDGCSMTGSQTVSSSSDLAVAVNPPRTLGPGGVDVPLIICPGAPMHYTANVTGGRGPYTYQWYRGNLQAIQGATGSTFDTTEQATLFSVVVTDSAGCVVSSNFTREFDYSVAVASIYSPDTIPFCPDRTARLYASLSNTYYEYGETAVSYRWSTGETAQQITVNQPGSYTVSIVSSLGCTVVSQPFVVSLYTPPSPAITPSGPTTFCAGGSVTLTASSASSYRWSNGATTQAITVSASGSYTVTTTNANGCSATSAPTTVTVNPLPTPAISFNVTSFCPETGVVATAPAGYTSYDWSASAGLLFTGQGTNSFAISHPGATDLTVSVTVTDANGCSATSTAILPARNFPKPAISVDATRVCPNGVVHATASAGPYTGYSWSVDNGTITSGEGTSQITFSPNGTGLMTVYLTVQGTDSCFAYSDAAPVEVDVPSATITPNGPTTFCAGSSVTLTASAGSSYLWSNGLTTQAINITDSGNYSVTVTDANGCSATSAATPVTVNSNPAPSVTAPAAICAGATGSASTASISGATYAWTITNGTITSGAGTSAITFTSASGPVSLGVTVTTASSCSGSATATVNVNAVPDATITAPAAICSGASASASVAATAGATYNWTITNGTITGGSGTAAITFTSSSGPVSLGVTVTSAQGCGASSSTNVTVNSNPAPSITSPAAICTGATGSASTGAITGATYAWTITNGTITSGSGTNAITFTSSSGPVTLGVTVTSNSCSGTASSTVNVNALPNATITAPAAICSGASGSASVGAVAGATYAWTITNGTITGGNGTNAITFTSASGTVSLGVTVSSNGCSASGSTNVAVNANPATPSITPGGATTFCAGGSVTLSAPASSGYLWSDGETTQSIVVSGSGTYRVAVINASGCTSAQSAPVTVTVNPATTITQQPASITIPKNTTTTLSVTATGTGTLTYQWYNPTTPSNTDTSHKVGTNSPTFTTPKLGSGPHYYYVTVTGTCGTARSAVATVTAN